MSDLNPPAFDPRQLVLPSVLAMLHEVERLLPPHPQANVIQAQHVLAQMGQALESVQLPGPAHLIATMAQVVQQHVGNHPQGEHSSDGEDPGARALALLRLADQDLRQYLQALEQGHDSDSQTLFDAYRALVRLGGKDSAHPADLWHPRGQARLAALPTALSTRAPSLEPSDAVRAQLDQTVLAWVKTGERALAEQLCQMCLGLSHTAPTPALCSAWQLLAGWLDAQAHGLLAPDMYAKRLAARLLMLYGQQLKGMQEPTAALLHEALFFCDLASRALHGPAASTAAICAAICQSCQLLPCLDAAPPEPEPELEQAQAEPVPEAVEVQPLATLAQGMAALPQVQAEPSALQQAQGCAQALHAALQRWTDTGIAATDETTAGALAAQLTRCAWDAGWAEIATLAHLIQRVVERCTTQVPPLLPTHCLQGCADIQRLLQQLAQGFVRRAQPQVVQDLEEWLRTLPAPIESAPMADTAASADAPPEPASQIEAADAGHASQNTEKDSKISPPVQVHELHPQHFAVLEEEMQTQWPLLERALNEWQATPQRCSPPALLRALHTLKGSARLAGAHAWASQVHAVESLAFAPDCSPETLAEPIQTLQLGFNALQQEMDARHPQRRQQHAALQPLERLQRHTQTLWGTQTDLQQHHQRSQTALNEAQVSLQRLRNLVQECSAWGDAWMMHGDMEASYEWHAELGDLLRNLMNAADDLGTVQQQLGHHQQETARSLADQASSLSALQHSLLYARLQPLEQIAPRLQECVQLAAHDCHKTAQLTMEGGNLRLEPNVLQALAPALEHLLRNCLAHGIESPQQRTAAGKPLEGHIHLRLQEQEGQHVLLLQDDGAGLDLEAIGARAAELGLWSHTSIPTDAQAAALILHPGLSTAQEVGPVAGRGIGMDAIQAQIHALGGQLHISSRSGKGCSVRITLPAPPRIETLQALRAGSWQVALPGNSIEGIRRIPLAAAQYALSQGMLPGDARGPLPLFWAGALWQQSSHSQETPIDQHALIVVVRSSTQRWGVWVDELLPPYEAVLQPPVGLRTPIAGLLGTAPLPNGQIVPVYAPAPVIAAHEARQRHSAAGKADAPTSTQADAQPSPSDADAPPAPLVMLVDDSVSVRRLAQHLLASHGWRVATAADGLDAWEQLQAGLEPALLLVDIEMPGMNGLELLRRLRARPQWQALSVVMLTAHEAGPVSQQALDMGAQAYLTKPYSPQQLLDQVRRYAGAAGASDPATAEGSGTHFI